MSKEDRIGTLIVVVLKAKNLLDRHSFYKQDVFSQVALNGSEKRTKVDVKGGQHPVWDDELRFPVMKDTSDKFRKLEVTCFSKESKSDDSLGSGILDITDTLKSGEFDDWIPLKLNGTQRGEVYLEMTYYANGPAPANYNTLERRPSKLKPADRLWRPPVTPPKGSPLRNEAPLPDPSRHLLPPSAASGASKRATSPSPSRHGDGTVLPPLGAGAGVQPGASSIPGGHVPSILRPGNPKSSTAPTAKNHGRHSSGGLPPLPQEEIDTSKYTGDISKYTGDTSKYTGDISKYTGDTSKYTGDTSRYTGAASVQQRPVSYLAPSQHQLYQPPDNNVGGFAFPVPGPTPAPATPVPYASTPVPYANAPTPAPYANAPTPAPSQYQAHAPSQYQAHAPYTGGYPQQPYPRVEPYAPPRGEPYAPPRGDPSPPGGYPASPGPLSPQMQGPHRQDSFPDPYLQRRYQTPLPLPPGHEQEDRRRQEEEQRRQEEEQRRQEEEKARGEETRRQEEARHAEEARLAEETRRLEEAQRAEEARVAEETKRAEEAKRAEEQARRAAEDARRVEEARRAEEARREAEEALRRAEEARRRAEEARLAEERRIAELRREEARRRAEEEDRQAMLRAQEDLMREERAARERADEEERLTLLRLQEEEERSMREQELRDMEMARQLDRELNLAEER
ncbi:hypothetical protein BD626DRAFT_543417 [Schizophyllum amplum]|uniref:C2 domain-containing protein n=1 Tax=Schizophyllum amplum TaxID=97359 RepID=A0A550BRR8_9AGAR|nr:hypothetical protein BD626DRAFT_543417 [Auriculariopsis ampla]